MGVAGLSVLAHVSTPPADSSSSCRWGKRSDIPFFPLTQFSDLGTHGFGILLILTRGGLLPHAHRLGDSPSFVNPRIKDHSVHSPHDFLDRFAKSSHTGWKWDGFPHARVGDCDLMWRAGRLA